MIIHQVIWGLVATSWAWSALAAIDAGKPTKIIPELQPIRDILALPEDRIELAKARLRIEQFLDPSVDIAANLKKIEQVVSEIRKVPRFSETTEGKLNGIIQYLYLPGDWNDYKPYHYDFDDPLGTTKPENRRVSHYLKTRKGNCVSMPMLVLILGERLGLDMSLSTAPKHYFVRLEDEGHFYNFEATAGGLKTNGSYVREFLITPEALQNGLYLQNLSKKQTVAIMLTKLAQHYADSTRNSAFDKALELTSLMLEHDPNNATTMIIRGNIWRNILYRDLEVFKAKKVQMTPPIKRHFDALLARNLQWYEKAESLGWREPPEDYDQRYLKMVNEARKTYE